jgi:hypothetical protein
LSALGGCRGCLDLEEYSLVPPSDASSGGVGGTGGSAGDCAATSFDGTLFAAFTAGAASDPASDCPIPADAGAGIDIVALDPAVGSCAARARILALEGAAFGEQPRLHHSSDATAVAGSFAGGVLEFPVQCATNQSVPLRQVTGADSTLFVARLRLDAGAVCTEWVRGAGITGGDPRVHDVAIASDGSIAVAGSLRGGAVVFSSTFPPTVGGAFLATWSPSGDFGDAKVLAAGNAADGVYAVDPASGSWTATGAALVEDPDCHSCTGTNHVTAAANECALPPDASASDASGTAGAGGADAGIADGSADGSVAGMGGSGGAGTLPDAAGPDTVNAFIMTSRDTGSCARFESFGSDQSATDLQLGYGISQRAASCAADVAGQAGADTWRMIGSDPRTALAAGNDARVDGFIARFLGGSTASCPSGFAWSLRLEGPGTTTGDRIFASRCSDSTTALAFVDQAAGGSLALRRCDAAGSCGTASRSASLGSTSTQQLVVLGLGGDGSLIWHGAFGPVARDPLPAGRVNADLALDRRDHVFLMFYTPGPLEVYNVDTTSCAELTGADAAQPATWVVGFARDGAGDRAACRWARRF